MAQKFNWFKYSNRLPENPQKALQISYIAELDDGKQYRIVTTCTDFYPEMYIKDGQFIYGGRVVDYWSPLPSVPKDAPLRYVEERPAINPMLCN